ncbi:hypothetical protein MLD38_033559 [Melastoma candidum]|uniref:Uncharacterized protein n=1 Tax=Melastoma candidum TaxID=119954 RepID=A0ACB9M797_9MYRT|nr:hypothetical protein MLD38_033559 [Melastoma candidum]
MDKRKEERKKGGRTKSSQEGSFRKYLEREEVTRRRREITVLCGESEKREVAGPRKVEGRHLGLSLTVGNDMCSLERAETMKEKGIVKGVSNLDKGTFRMSAQVAIFDEYASE